VVQCPYAKQVWNICLLTAGLNIHKRQLNNVWEDWWLRSRELVQSGDRGNLTLGSYWWHGCFGSTATHMSSAIQGSNALLIREKLMLWELTIGGGSRSQMRE
jgi:hypothetical protein